MSLKSRAYTFYSTKAVLGALKGRGGGCKLFKHLLKPQYHGSLGYLTYKSWHHKPSRVHLTDTFPQPIPPAAGTSFVRFEGDAWRWLSYSCKQSLTEGFCLCCIDARTNKPRVSIYVWAYLFFSYVKGFKVVWT